MTPVHPLSTPDYLFYLGIYRNGPPGGKGGGLTMLVFLDNVDRLGAGFGPLSNLSTVEACYW